MKTDNLIVAMAMLSLFLNVDAFKIINNTGNTVQLELTEAGPRPKPAKPGNLEQPAVINTTPHVITLNGKETKEIVIKNCVFLYVAQKKTVKLNGKETTRTITRLYCKNGSNRQELEINSDWGIILEEITPANAVGRDHYLPPMARFDFVVRLLNPEDPKDLKILQSSNK